MKNFLYIFVVLFALIGISLSFIKIDIKKDAKPPKEEGHLAKLIPASIGKFTSREIPLGETEEVIRSAEKILAVNEFMNRSYTTKEGLEFTLYISYWGEGKETLVRATVHTPDRCWVGVGWKNIDEKRQAAEILTVKDKELMPAYYREMTYDLTGDSVKRNIWFWFVANGERYDYATSDNMMPSIPKYVENTLIDAFSISPECYFIRIDSASDLRLLYKDEDFQSLLDMLGNLILYSEEK